MLTASMLRAWHAQECLPILIPVRCKGCGQGNMRTGADYLSSRQDGRQVVMDGNVVADITTHPAFAGVCRSVAGLYDRVAGEGEREALTFASPADGRPVSVGHMIPRSQEELRRRRLGLSRIADASYGL